MSFDIYDGQQQVDETELYLFQSTDIEGSTVVYGFTSSSTDILFTPTHTSLGEVSFTAEAVSRGAIPIATVGSAAQLSFQFNPNNEFAKKLALGTFYNSFRMAIIKIAPDGSDVVRFQGTVTQAIYKPTGIVVNCSSILDRLSNKVRTDTVSRLCPWSVYSSSCGSLGTESGILFSEFLHSVDTLNGTATVAAPLDNPGFPTDPSAFLGGLVMLTDPATTPILQQPRSYIQAAEHVEGVTKLKVTFSDASFASYILDKDPNALKLLKGCDKQVNTCKNTFSNSENFGGFPAIPREVAMRT